MKKQMTMMILTFIAATSMSAQRGHGHSTSTTTYHYNGDNYYDSNDRYNDTWNDNDNWRNRDRGIFQRYRRDDRLYFRMSGGDQRKLRRLENKLRERKRCALEDGFVSKKDMRRVREVENDINRLYARYSYRNQGNRNYNTYYNGRGNRGCR